MDIIFNVFSAISSDNALAEWMGFIFLTALILTLICNMKDPNRIWIASVFLCANAIDLFLVRVHLPEELLIRQAAYCAIDTLTILLLYFRIDICFRAFDIFRPKKDTFAIKVLKNVEATKQEYAIRIALVASIFFNALLMIEHLIRHPEYFNIAIEKLELVPLLDYFNMSIYPIAADPTLMKYIFVFDAYPYLKMCTTGLMILGLAAMSIDGIVNKRIKAGISH